MTIKATGEDTRGAFTLVEQLAPPGFGPPLHVHHREDEPFLVLEGRVRFRCGDREFVMDGGGYVFFFCPKVFPTHSGSKAPLRPAHANDIASGLRTFRSASWRACRVSNTSAGRRDNIRHHRSLRVRHRCQGLHQQPPLGHPNILTRSGIARAFVMTISGSCV